MGSSAGSLDAVCTLNPLVLESEWSQGAAYAQISRHSHGKLSRSPRKLPAPRAFILFESIFYRKMDALNSQTCMPGYGDGLLQHVPLRHSKGFKKKKKGGKKGITARENSLSWTSLVHLCSCIHLS